MCVFIVLYTLKNQEKLVCVILQTHTDGFPHSLLLLICTHFQQNCIQKAKEASVIHNPTEKRPEGGKKPFLFALHVNHGHSPIHSIFNYTEVEQEDRLA